MKTKSMLLLFAPLILTMVDRRGILGAAGLALSPRAAFAATKKPILVLGAGGGTGRACVEVLLQHGIPCIATTRQGILPYDAATRVAAADVTKAASLKALIYPGCGLGGVIFAASASAKGGDAIAVDRDGLVSTARACLDASVPRFVVVSSGTVTRPDSAVYQLLNLVGKGIMAAKIQGEEELRRLYAAQGSLGVSYTVIRPGGLTNDEPLGPGAIELNQGDNKSGRIARSDVAGLCVASLESASTAGTTFECYYRNTAKPVESVGISNILKSTDPTAFVSGRERVGNNFPELFAGLERDSTAAVLSSQSQPGAPLEKRGSFLRPPAAYANDNGDQGGGCDAACKQRIADRRALFQQSRTTNSRQEILELSKQRARLYNTTFQGVNCIPGIPCI